MRRVANRPRVRSSPGYDVFRNDRVVRPSRRSLPEPKAPVGKGGANRPKQLSCHRNKIGGPVSDVGIHDVTARLIEWRGGDPGAVARLLPLVHGELRRFAKRHMAGERSDQISRPPRPSTRSTSGWWIFVDGYQIVGRVARDGSAHTDPVASW